MKNSDIKEINNLTDHFCINWVMTRWCNYSCEYCISTETRNKDYTWLSEEYINSIADELIKLVIATPELSTKKLYFQLLGGEITYYNLVALISKFDKSLPNSMTFEITTNFSRDLAYFEELVSYSSTKANIDLICSYHAENNEFFNKFDSLNQYCIQNSYPKPTAMFLISKGTPEQFIAKLNTLREENNWNISTTALVNPNTNKNEAKNKDASKIKKVNKSFNAQLSLIREPKHRYEIVLTNGTRFYVSNINAFMSTTEEGAFIPTGCECDPAKRCLIIDQDGNCYANHCHYFSHNIYGNILKNNITIPFSTHLCTEVRPCRFCVDYSIKK